MILNWLYECDLAVLYSLTVVLIAGAAQLGILIGRRLSGNETRSGDINTVTGAALGLLALLLGFSFSLALSRFDVRRTLVLEEANAIGSTANFALMLPEPTQRPISNGQLPSFSLFFSRSNSSAHMSAAARPN